METSSSLVLHNAALCFPDEQERCKAQTYLANASKTVVGDHGSSPIHCAAQSGQAWVVEALINSKADVNAQTQLQRTTPLHVAALCGHVTVVDLLLKRGAIAATADSAGKTPLDIARANNRINVVQLLEAQAMNTSQTYVAPMQSVHRLHSLQPLQQVQGVQPVQQVCPVTVQIAGYPQPSLQPLSEIDPMLISQNVPVHHSRSKSPRVRYTRSKSPNVRRVRTAGNDATEQQRREEQTRRAAEEEEKRKEQRKQAEVEFNRQVQDWKEELARMKKREQDDEAQQRLNEEEENLRRANKEEARQPAASSNNRQSALIKKVAAAEQALRNGTPSERCSALNKLAELVTQLNPPPPELAERFALNIFWAAHQQDDMLTEAAVTWAAFFLMFDIGRTAKRHVLDTMLYGFEKGDTTTRNIAVEELRLLLREERSGSSGNELVPEERGRICDTFQRVLKDGDWSDMDCIDALNCSLQMGLAQGTSRDDMLRLLSDIKEKARNLSLPASVAAVTKKASASV